MSEQWQNMGLVHSSGYKLIEESLFSDTQYCYVIYNAEDVRIAIFMIKEHAMQFVEMLAAEQIPTAEPVPDPPAEPEQNNPLDVNGTQE